jgi:hypothetical protein
MVQVQFGSESSALSGYYYYDDSDGQKWLANMSFSIAGLDYAKIMASGPLHFGVLWNIKSEIASGLGVPFENVSIFLSDAGNLNIAAVVVGPWMTKLDPTPADIDIHLLDRIKAIPDIDSAKTTGFTADLRLSVSTRRHDDGLWTTTTTTTSDGRRRRSPATHSPTTAPAMCLVPYTGQNVNPGGQNTAAGTAVKFSCTVDVAGKNTKYPATGQVECVGLNSWAPYSSGSDVTNWGCGGEDDCWELPHFKMGSGADAETKPLASDSSFNNQILTPPFDPTKKGAVYCADASCCADPTTTVLKAGPVGNLQPFTPTCETTADKSGQFVSGGLPEPNNNAWVWKCA